MKVVLFGATDIAQSVGDRLSTMDGTTVVGCVGAPPVITASFAPAGRPNVRHVDLATWASSRGIPHHTYADHDQLRTFLSGIAADVGLVAGWHHLIPSDCIDRFSVGAVGFHASLLPKLRGAAPLNWAILSGANETGMSMFRLGHGVDDGPLIGQLTVSIGPRTTIQELIDDTTAAALDLLDLLPRYVRGEISPDPQEGEASYSLHRSPADGRIDWGESVFAIDRLIRAVGRPYAGAYTLLDGEEISIWAAEPLEQPPEVWSVPGGILRLPGVDEPLVVTGSGLLRVIEASDATGGDALGRLRRSGHRRLL